LSLIPLILIAFLASMTYLFCLDRAKKRISNFRIFEGVKKIIE